MKAVVCDRYGPPDVLRLAEVERPVPADDELLVRVHASTVNRTDCGMRGDNPFYARFFFGLRRPKKRIMGNEFAGVVESVGPAVTGFSAGDRVFGVKSIFGTSSGTHAEYTCVPASAPVAPMPANMSFEEAAAVCDGALLALWSLRAANLQEGQSILVYGASGSIGTAAVQLAKYFGADVTAVCGTRNLALVRSLGASEVIDYTREDFTRNGKTYDVIFDAVGKHSFWRCRGSLKPGGIYLATYGFLHLVLTPLTARFGSKRVLFAIPPRFTQQDVRFLKQLIEAGSYRAVIDRRYPLAQVVEASRYVATEHKTGNVVLTVSGESPDRLQEVGEAAPATTSA